LIKLRSVHSLPVTINDIESINDIFSDGLIPIIADLLTIIITLATMFLDRLEADVDQSCIVPYHDHLPLYYFKESVNKSFIRDVMA